MLVLNEAVLTATIGLPFKQAFKVRSQHGFIQDEHDSLP